ncbi:MAG: hypothetical protein M1828_002300 [Chrysothrix sp. TS-e1954]|nr:MAG: hypothetical protein M1828_002300 [Chrysothrix sp. TS-e1954]
MTSNMMDTEAGGESTQYESIQTVTNPGSKQGGQLGEAQTSAPTTSQSQSAQRDQGEAAERSARTTENIRYGQTISEGGMGGQTTTNSGAPSTQGGFGGTQASSGSMDTGSASESREASGYGGEQDSSREVGA